MRLRVNVPATSANLGPGFDAFGMALDLCNEVTVDTDAPPAVTWDGEGADELPTDGSDMISEAVRSVAASMALEAPQVAMHGRNTIPLARGLGSSAAAVVAGIAIASRLLDLGIDRDPASMMALATAIEGHPDNAAPAIYGGITIATADGFVRNLTAHPSLRPVAIVPDARLPTAEARAALPSTVPFADAVFNATHAALMVEALTKDPDLLRIALQDRLHEDVRLARVPAVDDVVRELRHRAVPVCVSGAGPTLLAFQLDGGPDVATLAADVAPTWRIWPMAVRSRGFEITEG
jgi:homoserine kinase